MKHSSQRWRWLAVVAAVATLLAADALWVGEALARSGGSFGGGFKSSSRSSSSGSSRSFGSSSSGSRSFGSSSSGSSGSSGGYRPSAPSYGGTRYVPVPVPIGGGYGSSYGYRPGYSSYGYASPSRGSSWVSVIVLLLVIGFVVFVVVAVVRRRRVSGDGSSGDSGTADQPVDVTLLQFGVQMQARSIQDKLEKLAERTNADDEGSLAFALRTLALEMTAHAENVEYGSIQRLYSMPLPKAEDQFNLWASNERGKFNREVIRAGSQGIKRQQKEWQTDGLRDEDGQLAVAEFFVISVVLASRNTALPKDLRDSSQLTETLDGLAGIRTDQLVALEVVWSPAATSDSMSREDMESRYPSLVSL